MPEMLSLSQDLTQVSFHLYPDKKETAIMTVYKKIVCIALSLILTFSVFSAIICFTTVAKTEPILSAENKTAKPGQQ